jgi:hypothetical protein
MSGLNSYLDKMSPKFVNYWQSVLWFGLPFIILYQGVDYAIFRITVDNAPVRYPWWIKVGTDVPYMFLVSTLWWAFMRRVATLKTRIQHK